MKKTLIILAAIVVLSGGYSIYKYEAKGDWNHFINVLWSAIGYAKERATIPSQAGAAGVATVAVLHFNEGISPYNVVGYLNTCREFKDQEDCDRITKYGIDPSRIQTDNDYYNQLESKLNQYALNHLNQVIPAGRLVLTLGTDTISQDIAKGLPKQ